MKSAHCYFLSPGQPSCCWFETFLDPFPSAQTGGLLRFYYFFFSIIVIILGLLFCGSFQKPYFLEFLAVHQLIFFFLNGFFFIFNDIIFEMVIP